MNNKPRIMTESYKDYKIGQRVKCYNLNRRTERFGEDLVIINDNPSLDFWEEKLIVGKEYKIDDVDFHFPDKIAVKTEYGGHAFVPIVFFIPLLEDERDEKLKELGI